MHFADVKTACSGLGVKFDDVVGAAITVGRPPAKRTRTDDFDLTICSVAKPCVQELRSVLMAVKSKTEATIDQVLEEIGVNII